MKSITQFSPYVQLLPYVLQGRRILFFLPLSGILSKIKIKIKIKNGFTLDLDLFTFLAMLVMNTPSE